MNQEIGDVPSNYRGLRILLLDNDTTSLLDIASKLENFSYKVTTTELQTIALSILQEGADRFDLIMADINMPEMDCLKFVKSVLLIKDLPIILISAKKNKSVVEEAIIEGASFFLRKPISAKNLINVWQHFCRETRCKNVGKVGINKSGGDQEARKKVRENVIKIVDGGNTSNVQVEVGDQARTDQGGLVDGTKQVEKKRAMTSEENDEPGEIKRGRSENEGGMTSQNPEGGPSNEACLIVLDE